MREVHLKDKPFALLEISPNGTVPVLQLPDGNVIDQSLKIMEWALQQSDHTDRIIWRDDTNGRIQSLIDYNDTTFVKIIHKYKYRECYSKNELIENEVQLSQHLHKLDTLLKENTFLVSNRPSIADLALFPFVRQVFMVNPDDFQKLGLIHLTRWLHYFVKHPLFLPVMAKHPIWQPNQEPIIFS